MSAPARPVLFTASRLGLKMAGVAFLGTLAVLFLVDLIGMGGERGAVLAALGVSIVVYLAADLLLTRRLELARRTLKDVRKHHFESLEKLHVPRGDELNALIWQVYRTGLTLEKEIGELRKIENYRRDYLGNVSHELKTPIFAIQGFADTLLDGALDDPRYNRPFVEKILRNTMRLQHLARDLAELTRIETGELRMALEPFSLASVAAEVVEALEAQAVARHLTLTQHLADTLPLVMGDRERIRQVLTNLVENAIKYNQAGGFVDVVARLLPDGRVKVTVADNGIGVAPQHVARLTERFYRVDKSRSREQGGTGLGLAIVKHILVAHQSTLLVESKEGQGSSFGFTLPVARRTAE